LILKPIFFLFIGVKYSVRGFSELTIRKKMVSVLTMGTLTRADLTESVYRNIGLSRNESSDLVEAVLEEICSCLEAGEEVKLSSFGTFSVQSKSERVGRNPKTGIEAVITPRRVLSFRPSHILKDRVDGAK
jgi:integration host factor subunit alpha